MIYTIQKYKTDHKQLWNTFISEAKNATFLFQRDFMEYHSDRFVDHSLLIFKAETLVAVLPANRAGETVHSHQGLTYGGLVIKDNLKLKDTLDVFNSVLQFLETEGVKTCVIKVLPSIYTTAPSEGLDYLLFILKSDLFRKDVLSVIDYKAVPKTLSKVRKRGLKRAEKHGLIIKEESNFEGFWNTVLIPNLEKRFNKKPVHSLAEIKQLHQQFPNKIRQFNVYYNNTIVAGTTIFETKTVAHAQYISAIENKQELGSLDVLFHHLIHTVFKEKHYFDFGISNENQGKNINEGLLYWKESFGARTITQDFYSLDTANHNLLDAVLL